MVVFKSIAEAETLLPDLAQKIDLIGYNLEHGPATPAEEQADPVGSIQKMRLLADTYELDLGTLLTYWTETADPPYMQAMAMMPVGEMGFMTRAQLVERYALKSGRSVADISFYHTLGLFRVTVIIAQIYYRYKKGQTQDERFAFFQTMIPMMARAAQERAGI